MVGEVVKLPVVEVSDLAKALLSLETERLRLDSEAAQITAAQVQIMETAAVQVAALSDQHHAVLKKRIAVDEAILSMLSARAL